MARINLLPWREELREERRKRFLLALVGALVGAVGVILVAVRYIDNAIDHQVARNSHLPARSPCSMSASSRSAN